jgi:hypothetical protein
MRATSTRRGGFTLVELFVVLGVILVLIGIAVLVANSGLVGNLRTTGGTDRIAGWLMQARARAQRDAAPRGVRFIPDANGFIREAVLIEVPEPYVAPAGLQLMVGQWPGGPGLPVQKHIYLVDQNPATRVASYNDVRAGVAVGDTLSIPDLGTIHQVSGVTNVSVTLGGAATPALEITVVNAALIPDLGAAASTVANVPTFATGTFGILRQPRPVFGEPSLPVPEGIAIAMNLANTTDPTNVAQPSLSLITPTVRLDNGVNTTHYDVVFSPNGEIQNAGGLGRVVLWVRNPEALATSPRAGGDLRTTYESAGEMTFVVVYTKTGAVAIHPVAMPGDDNAATAHDPYAYTKDGIASGL